ncbi:hypothetical protein IAU60_000579 [Kwoniella sp. DSM 27419]
MPTSKSSKSSIDNRDVYYRLGKSAGYRARSAYKLLHLDEEFDLFTGVQTAVDLCAAPGSWSQVLGQKLKPTKENDGSGRRVVSLDLQPMAPLPNITTLKTDITLPSTIPLVLDALGGRRADLVVCDGAPDVTGVHDLDAYLHSQLLLAALTLSLTLLAPGATLIFKIFLSPLDPQAAFLTSQLRCFFPSPPVTEGQNTFEEFDEGKADAEAPGDMKASTSGLTSAQHAGKSGYDPLGRRGGVWVRKPRSSRKGSGEAFIVCRNFDARSVPLPVKFSPEALAELRSQTTGTLTLESLATLCEGAEYSKAWERVKGYVGGGDLHSLASVTTQRTSPQPVSKVELRLPEPSSHDHLTTSPKALFAQPTPLDGPSEYFHPRDTDRAPTSPTHSKGSAPSTLLYPEQLHIETRRLAGPAARATNMAMAEGSRGLALDALTPSPTPVTLVDPSRPWTPTSSPYSPPRQAASAATLGIPSGSRLRSGSNASISSLRSERQHEDEVASSTPLVSPALSSSSKTDLFFAAAASRESLPVPPRALPNAAALGRGLPSSTGKKVEDRSASMPVRREILKDASALADATARTSAWAERGAAIELASPSTSSQGYSALIPEFRPDGSKLGFAFEDISTTSRLRSMSNPAPLGEPAPVPVKSYSPVTSRFLQTGPTEPLATLPSLPDVKAFAASPSGSVLATGKRPSIQAHGRRESQQLEREMREAKHDVEVQAGNVILPEVPGDAEEKPRAGTTPEKRRWKLVRKLGEGAFSSVWSAVPASTTEAERGGRPLQVAALKMMDRQLSLRDSRTRISFLREVEVLRHISHPSIVSYLDSFTTPTHHVLVLEELSGGELFDLMSDDENRRRMILPSPQKEVEAVVLAAGSSPRVWDSAGEGFVRRVFGELTRAVGWLHEVGVVHRDIKLENILFTVNPFTLPPTSTGSIPLHHLPQPGPLIKLTDFGLSRFISPASPLLQTRCGSESFAAPEIIMGRSYDGRETDAWAMGVVLYGLIVGELPFDREEEYPGGSGPNTPSSARPWTPSLDARSRGRKKMLRIAKGEYSFPDAVGSRDARGLVGKLLVRDPKKRARLVDLWDEPFMDPSREGAIPRPLAQTPTPTPGATPGATPGEGSAATGLGERRASGKGRRRVLDGFLVEEDGIEEVARAEL